MTPARPDRAVAGRHVGALVVLAVLARPLLWWSGLAALRRMAAPGWWRRRPFLPLPAGAYWAFRMTTAYGDPGADPVPEDVISFLSWYRSTAASRRPGRPR